MHLFDFSPPSSSKVAARQSLLFPCRCFFSQTMYICISIFCLACSRSCFFSFFINSGFAHSLFGFTLSFSFSFISCNAHSLTHSQISNRLVNSLFSSSSHTLFVCHSSVPPAFSSFPFVSAPSPSLPFNHQKSHMQNLFLLYSSQTTASSFRQTQ